MPGFGQATRLTLSTYRRTITVLFILTDTVIADSAPNTRQEKVSSKVAFASLHQEHELGKDRFIDLISYKLLCMVDCSKREEPQSENINCR